MLRFLDEHFEAIIIVVLMALMSSMVKPMLHFQKGKRWKILL